MAFELEFYINFSLIIKLAITRYTLDRVINEIKEMINYLL